MAFLKWPSKDPNEVLDYRINWAPRLAQGDAISTSTWILPEGDLDTQSDSNTDTTTTIWLTLGTLGESYTLINRVVTNDGRTMDQSVTLKIAER